MGIQAASSISFLTFLVLRRLASPTGWVPSHSTAEARPCDSILCGKPGTAGSGVVWGERRVVVGGVVAGEVFQRQARIPVGCFADCLADLMKRRAVCTVMGRHEEEEDGVKTGWF